MESRTPIQDAALTLKKAIEALQAGTPIEALIREARNWLEVARIRSASDDEQDEIHLWECYASCLTNDFDAAYKEFQRTNSGRAVPRSWQHIGIIIYSEMSLPADLAEGLRQFDAALNWEVIKERSTDMDLVKGVLYGRKAFYHLKMNRYADATASCEIALDFLPHNLTPLRIMAEIKMLSGEYDRAIEYLSKVIAIRTEGPHFWDYANRGSAFLETGNLQEAYKDFRTALELEPGNPVVLCNLGIALEQRGDFTEAGRCYSLALTQDYDSVPAHNNRGTLIFSRQDYPQAEREFTIATQLEPRNGTLWFNRGLARFEMQMYGECLSDMSISIGLGNQSWEAQYISAMCKARLKEYSTAIALLKDLILKSILDRENNSTIWNNIGVMEHHRGWLDTAHRCFLESAAEDPLNEQAQLNIDRIQSTMSGEDLQTTEDSQIEIAPRATKGHPLALTRSEIINTVSIASSWGTLAWQHLT